MTKFNKYEPQPRDLFRSTDPNIFPPLIPYIRGKTYAEPCYGYGDLEDGLMDAAKCGWRSDLLPQFSSAVQRDALDLTKEDLKDCDIISTNPPFQWAMLKPLLEYLPTLKPTWLLLPSDSMHNKQMAPFMNKCSLIVSVGRLYFHKQGEDINSVKYSRGTANHCWYLFHDNPQVTQFVGWTPK